jgi:hypothetical protein
VVGTGVNVQAARLANCSRAEDWDGLLNQIAIETGMDPAEAALHPTSPLATWEALVVQWAEHHQLDPYEAEGQLHKRVVEGLRALENTAPRDGLYRAFVDAAFCDMVSLNFDRRIALAADKEVFLPGPADPHDGPSARTFYRHSQFTANGHRTSRIWYPHGDTRLVETLRLGVRRYGFHLALIREHLGGLAPGWRDGRRREEGCNNDVGHEGPSWVEIFMTRPLLFLGCGLSRDEWSLWWLLQQRAAHPTSEPAYFAFVGDLVDSVKCLGPARGLVPVEFSSHDRLWEFIQGAFAA